MNGRKHLDQGRALRRGEPFKHFIDHRAAQFVKIIDHRAGAFGKVDAPGAPIMGIAAALGQPGLFEPIDHAATGDGLYFEHLSDLALVQPWLAIQDLQYAPLRHTRATRTGAFIESAPHQARDIAQQKSDTVTHERGHNKDTYYIQFQNNMHFAPL